jgi:hypothetical protein
MRVCGRLAVVGWHFAHARACQQAIWKWGYTFGNLAFTRRGVEQLGSSLGS